MSLAFSEAYYCSIAQYFVALPECFFFNSTRSRAVCSGRSLLTSWPRFYPAMPCLCRVAAFSWPFSLLCSPLRGTRKAPCSLLGSCSLLLASFAVAAVVVVHRRWRREQKRKMLALRSAIVSHGRLVKLAAKVSDQRRFAFFLLLCACPSCFCRDVYSRNLRSHSPQQRQRASTSTPSLVSFSGRRD